MVSVRSALEIKGQLSKEKDKNHKFVRCVVQAAGLFYLVPMGVLKELLNTTIASQRLLSLREELLVTSKPL